MRKFIYQFAQISLLVIGSTPTLALDLSAGVAAIDDTGDQAEPAATIRLGWTNSIQSQLYYWGRDFSVVSERQGLLAFTISEKIPGLDKITARYGLVASAHRTVLYSNKASKDIPEKPQSESLTDYNGGGSLGIGLPIDLGSLRLDFAWDSHFFPVGGGALIFLASSRKQTLSATVGVDL